MLGRTCHGPLSLAGGSAVLRELPSAQHDQANGARHPRALCSGVPQTGVLVLMQPRIQSWVSGFGTTVAFSPSPQLLAQGR